MRALPIPPLSCLRRATGRTVAHMGAQLFAPNDVCVQQRLGRGHSTRCAVPDWTADTAPGAAGAQHGAVGKRAGRRAL